MHLQLRLRAVRGELASWPSTGTAILQRGASWLAIVLACAIGCNRGEEPEPDDKRPAQDKLNTLPQGHARQVDRATPNPVPSPALRLTVTRKGEDDAGIVLELINESGAKIKWDPDFAVGVAWRIRNEDGSEVVPVEKSQEEHSVEADTRFIVLQPGESAKKTIRLDSVRRFSHGRAGIATPDGSSVVVPVGWDSVLDYIAPAGSNTLRVAAEYQPLDDDAADAFATYFGIRPEKFGLYDAVILSNEVEVPIKR